MPPSTKLHLVLLVLAALAGGCFPHQAGPELAHFASRAPAVGDSAPDFDLVDLDGRSVRLADLHGERPTVLRFGSHSCPVYRYRRFGFQDLVEDYRERVHFVVVYTLEAHPDGSKSPFADREWNPAINRALGVRIAQPTTDAERIAQARRSATDLELVEKLVVDTLDNATWHAYGSAASPAFVLDREGRIVLRQVWADPRPIRDALDRLLTPKAVSVGR